MAKRAELGNASSSDAAAVGAFAEPSAKLGWKIAAEATASRSSLEMVLLSISALTKSSELVI